MKFSLLLEVQFIRTEALHLRARAQRTRVTRLRQETTAAAGKVSRDR
jgi:hypothetical protein